MYSKVWGAIGRARGGWVGGGGGLWAPRALRSNPFSPRPTHALHTPRSSAAVFRPASTLTHGRLHMAIASATRGTASAAVVANGPAAT